MSIPRQLQNNPKPTEPDKEVFDEKNLLSTYYLSIGVMIRGIILGYPFCGVTNIHVRCADSKKMNTPT